MDQSPQFDVQTVFARHYIETSDGRRWASLAAAYSPVIKTLTAKDTQTGRFYPAVELYMASVTVPRSAT